MVVTAIARPSRNCTHPGCRTPQRPGSSYCAAHHNAKWDTRRKQTQGHQSKEYYRERQAVKRDRWHCHLEHLGGCCLPRYTKAGVLMLHTHHTRSDTHHRSTLAPLCERHHMQLEQQGKDGALQREVVRILAEVVA